MKNRNACINYRHSDRGAADEESNNRSSRRYAPQDDEGRKKGFTLVELSIVLVIIGLLIGGILVGQSLIESAKMQRFVRDMAQYDSAVALFKGKYGQLPGDSGAFGCIDDLDTAGNICNNGTIEGIISSNIIYFFSETSLFWKQLSDSGFKPEGKSFSETIPASTIVTTGINVPKAQIGTAGVAVYGSSGVNKYYIGGYVALGSINFEPGLSAVDSLAFDSKVDDGIPDTGNVEVGLSADSGACNTEGVGAAYTIASGNALVCTLAVRMLSGIDF